MAFASWAELRRMKLSNGLCTVDGYQIDVSSVDKPLREGMML